MLGIFNQQKPEIKMIKEAVDHLNKGNFNSAFRRVALFHVKNPKPALYNWDRAYKEGISEFLLEASMKFLRTVCDVSAINKEVRTYIPGINVFCLAYVYSGINHKRFVRLLREAFPRLFLRVNEEDVRCYLLTAGNYFYTLAHVEASPQDAGKYKILSALDDRTCPKCGEMDGRVFSQKEMKVGINAPPFHEKCRCTLTYVLESGYEYTGSRTARDPVTRASYQTKCKTYTEWLKSLNPEQLNEMRISRLKALNKASDKEQYAQFKKVFGSEIPTGYLKFQDFKYRHEQQFSDLKEKMRASQSDTVEHSEE